VNRRHFIRSISVLPFSLFSAPAQPSLTPTRKFTLCQNSSGVLISCDILGERIYYLQRDRTSRDYIIGCTAADGNPVWSATLPKGYYTSVAVRGSASVLVHRIGVGVEEYDSKGKRLGVTRVWTNNPFHALVGNLLVAARHDSNIEVLDTATLGRETSQRLSQYRSAIPPAPSQDFLAVEAISERDAVVINKASAAMRRVDVKSGASTAIQWDSPEIKRSLDTYAAKKQEAMASKGITNLNSISLPATGHDSSGSIYCLVSPYKLEAALVLMLSPTGKTMRRIWCVLPNRMQPEYTSPMRIFVSGTILLIIFTGGGVAAYSLTTGV